MLFYTVAGVDSICWYNNLYLAFFIKDSFTVCFLVWWQDLSV